MHKYQDFPQVWQFEYKTMITKRRKPIFTNAVALFLVCILLIRILDNHSFSGLIIGNDGPDEVKAAALDCNKTPARQKLETLC